MAEKQTPAVEHDGWDEYRNERIYRNRGKIGFGRSLGYGVFAWFSIAMQGLVGAWLLFFYTNFAGLSAAAGASIFLVGRVADALASLLMGNFSDTLYKFKFGRKFGRRHFFILIAAPCSLIAITMWVSGMSYWYYLVTYVLTTILMSVLQIPWETLPNEMTKDYNERTKMSTTRMVLAGLGNMLVAFVPAQLFRIWPKSSPVPYLVAQIGFSVVCFILVLVTYYTTWEHFVSKKEAEDIARTNSAAQNAHSFKSELSNYFSTFSIKSFRKHMGIYLFSYLGAFIWTTIFVYYIVDVIGGTASDAGYLQSFSIVSIPVTIIAGYLVTKISPRALYTIGYSLMILAAICYGAVAVFHIHNWMVLLSIVTFAYEIGLYILYFVPWNTFPFLPDLDTLVTGQNRSGLFASVMVFINQVCLGFASVIVGYMLDWAGLVKSTAGSVQQPQSAQNMIVGLMVLGVGGLILVALLFASRFHLNRKTIKVLDDELTRLQKGGYIEDVDPNTRKVCEDLTGVSFDEITVWNSHKKPASENVIK